MTNKQKEKLQTVVIDGVDFKPVTLPIGERPLHRFNSTTFQCGIFTLTVKEMQDIVLYWNNGNRPMPSANYEKLMQDIVSNRYLYDAGNPLQFNVKGDCINGQTRMWAHLALNKELTTVVVWGCNINAIDVVDIHSPRQPALVSLMSEMSKTGQGSLTHESLSIRRIEYGVVNAWVRNDNEQGKQRTYSNLETDEFLKKHRTAIAWATQKVDNSDTKRAGYLSAMAKYYEIDPVKADILFQQVGGDGSNIPMGYSPARCMVRYLDNQVKRSRTRQMDDYYSTLKVIHAFHAGVDIQKISIQKEWNPKSWFLEINENEQKALKNSSEGVSIGVSIDSVSIPSKSQLVMS
jgi:hypothetical protein